MNRKQLLLSRQGTQNSSLSSVRKVTATTDISYSDAVKGAHRSQYSATSPIPESPNRKVGGADKATGALSFLHEPCSPHDYEANLKPVLPKLNSPLSSRAPKSYSAALRSLSRGVQSIDISKGSILDTSNHKGQHRSLAKRANVYNTKAQTCAPAPRDDLNGRGLPLEKVPGDYQNYIRSFVKKGGRAEGYVGPLVDDGFVVNHRNGNPVHRSSFNPRDPAEIVSVQIIGKLHKITCHVYPDGKITRFQGDF